MSKVYTKTGDAGKTGLFGGERVWKDDQRVGAYGALDELNSCLGVVSSFNNHNEIKIILKNLQSQLMSISAVLANPSQKVAGDYLQKEITALEKMIDAKQAELPKQTSFILPGGSHTAALLQLSRTVCRRAEREAVRLSRQEPVSPGILPFLNRLSDLLYVLALWINKQEKVKETVWKK